jgi:uncharacterized protein with PIN domain
MKGGKKMFKNVIAPIQAWLLSQSRCVGCSAPLSQGKKEEAKDGKAMQVTCKCGRIYIYNPKTKTYRRALFEEV